MPTLIRTVLSRLVALLATLLGVTTPAAALGYAQREDTSGTILRDWNDVSGRDTAAVTGLIDTVLASL